MIDENETPVSNEVDTPSVDSEVLEELSTPQVSSNDDIDDRYPEMDASEQEALQREYDEQEFQDEDLEIDNKTIEEVAARAREATDKLKLELRGSVLLEIQDSETSYSFDWSAGSFKFSQEADSGDCKISLSQRHLAQIARGRLNPQIAMLSDKIKVEGKTSLAVFFFNVVAPAPRN